ncbi:MAG: hypothetical protein DDT35_00647 [Firmicutes bacterium]|nr:hypothetical protein [Bacillota bacterium]
MKSMPGESPTRYEIMAGDLGGLGYESHGYGYGGEGRRAVSRRYRDAVAQGHEG